MRKPKQPRVKEFYAHQRNKKAHGATVAKPNTVSFENNSRNSRQTKSENQPITRRSMHGCTHFGRNLSFGIYLLTERKPSHV